MSEAAGNWSTQQLAEFLAVISSCENEAEATQEAVERTAEALEAEVCVYFRDGEVIDSIGFPPGSASPDSLAAVVSGATEALDVPGVGTCPTMVVPVVGQLDGHLILARVGNGFDAAERGLVRSMGRALSLSVGILRTLDAERERRELLGRLSRIQRSISHHSPIRELLDQIAEGASQLLGEQIAAAVVIDPEADQHVFAIANVGMPPDAPERQQAEQGYDSAAKRAMQRDALVLIEDFQSEPNMMPVLLETGIQSAIASPVRVSDQIAGALVVASRNPARRFNVAEQEALVAFADHAGLAVTDARLADQVDRALHDSLTGLPNRTALGDRLAERLKEGSEPALISLDLDKFRAVNDRVGHADADRVLIELASRLQSHAGQDAIVGRLEGDCFAMVCGREDARTLADGMLGVLREPFVVDGRELQMTVSVGVTEGGDTAEQMLRDADLAMYRAKSDGGSRVVSFEPGMRTELVKRLELQDDLARAIEDGEIIAHFQPKVDLRSARVIGVEALVRWDHPERGLVSPGEFLPLAEAGGHMRALTERVIEFSTRAAGDWWHSGLGLQLSVNLAPSSFSEPDWNLDEFVAKALARTGLPGKALQFEVTEDALMADPEIAAKTLKMLSKLGATISIDDFGTGHSSLGRLKSLPIDELKIDRSFILEPTDDDKTIVRSTIHLAHQMGLQVVAEGVETEEAWRQLRSMGAERAQGFLIAKPLAAREVPAWLATWNHRARELSSTKRVQRRSKARAQRAKPAEATA